MFQWRVTGTWISIVAIAALSRPLASHRSPPGTPMQRGSTAAGGVRPPPPLGVQVPLAKRRLPLAFGCPRAPAPFLPQAARRAVGVSGLRCAGDAGPRGGADEFARGEGESAASALTRAIVELKEGGVPEAVASAEILLSHVTGATRSRIRTEGSRITLSPLQAARFQSHVAERLARTPVQYILGEWDFYNLDNLIVRPPTLIPRPETEELVHFLIQHFKTSDAPARILEVGPGSGAIILSLIKEWKEARAVAVDLCDHAVQLTRDNAEQQNLSERLTVQHIGISEYHRDGGKGGPFDLLVSNPPYIPSQDMAGLEPEVVAHEDRLALDGGDDGLDIVRQILKAAGGGLVRPGGEVWMEVDVSHPELLATGMGCPDGVEVVEWRRDLTGRPRFVRWTVSR